MSEGEEKGQREPTHNFTSKKRADQKDVGFDYLFATSSDFLVREFDGTLYRRTRRLLPGVKRAICRWDSSPKTYQLNRNR